MPAVNRLAGLTGGYVDRHQSLRWVDLLNMTVLPLARVLATARLRRILRGGAHPVGAGDRALDVVFVAGAYLLAAGNGMHEVTNYLHVRFCSPSPAATGQLCDVVAYDDDQFSHGVFFAGFVLLNLSVLLMPLLVAVREPARGRHLVAVAANAVVFAAAVFANLAFEELGADLDVVAVIAVIAAVVWWRRRRDAIVVYYLLAYWLGLGSTLAVQVLA